MALQVDWITRIITVPQADLTPVGGSVYELDINAFRLELKDLEDDEGMPFLTTHSHNTEVTISGVTLARVVEIINGYTVTFEDGQYAVNLIGANTNIADVTNVNQVSVRPSNIAGLTSFPSVDEIAASVWRDIISQHDSVAGSAAEVLANGSGGTTVNNITYGQPSIITTNDDNTTVISQAEQPIMIISDEENSINHMNQQVIIEQDVTNNNVHLPC